MALHDLYNLQLHCPDNYLYPTPLSQILQNDTAERQADNQNIHQSYLYKLSSQQYQDFL